MSQYNEGPRKGFTAAAAIGINLRVKITDASTSPITINVAGASDPSIGVVEDAVLAAGPCTVLLANAAGTRKMVASGSITGGNPVYAAATGKVASSGSVVEGKAFETTTANNDILEVLSTHNSDISTAISGTTAVGFEVDNDSSAPKIKLLAQSGGSGDYTTTLKPEATLSGDTSVIVPEVDGTLAALELAQTFTARQGFTGNTILLAGVGITGAAESFVAYVDKIGTVFCTTIVIDLTGLNSGGTADDIIGDEGAGDCTLGQITAAVNGTIFAIRMTCLETPATGDDDIDLWSADEDSGVEDTLITDLSNQVQLTDGGDLTSGSVVGIIGVPIANQYLYLTGKSADANATYTAGKLLIELWGE